MQAEWNYHDDDPERGPSKWARVAAAGAGRAQSPIDIQVDFERLRLHQQQVGCRCGHKLGARSRRLDSAGHEEEPGAEEEPELLVPELELELGDEDSLGRSSSFSSNSSGGGGGGGGARQATGVRARPAEGSALERLARRAGGQKTRFCATNKKIFLGYPRYLNSVRLCNTGHAWQVDMPRELAEHTLLSVPALAEREYRLAQLHCHWGSDCEHGSEHLLNGRAFSAEIHFVHWNCSQFGSLEEAARHRHGLCVLAVFVEALEGEQHRNKHLERIVSALPQVLARPHSSLELPDARLDLKKLFPANRWLYATYEGSLTTPPLSEVVDWVVFLQPISCSRRQVDQFRELQCSTRGEKLSKNCRPVQPLNERVVSVWTHAG